MEKSIFNEPLLESLLTIDLPGLAVDLHNDFECVSIISEEEILVFKFVNKNGIYVNIIIIGFIIMKAEMVFNFSGPLTLDNLYRGRITEGQVLVDADENGRHCFYFHFDENVYLEVLAKEVLIDFFK